MTHHEPFRETRLDAHRASTPTPGPRASPVPDEPGHGRRSGGGPRPALVAIAAFCLLIGVVLVVRSAVTTSSARVAATTGTNGFVSAGTVELGITDAAELFFDADGLYPGLDVLGCVEIVSDGSVPVDVRISGTFGDGSGLERFVDFGLVVVEDATCDDPIPSIAPTAFDGRLDEFARRHRSYATGLVLTEGGSASRVVAVHSTVEIVDDNDAAGLDSSIDFVVESRPV